MNCILLTDITSNRCIIRNTNQINHVRTVLRSEIGDMIKVGAINNNIGTAIIRDIQKDLIELSDIKLDTPPPRKLNLTVILALPRPKVLRRLIMDMTAQGVNKIILVNSYRTEKSYWQSPLLNRLDEFVHEGLQQAIDTIPPEIELHKRFKPFVEDELTNILIDKDAINKKNDYHNAVVTHPYVDNSWQDYKMNSPLPQVLCIGAEGGWIDYEVELLREHGCEIVSFGSRILRTETAVNALLGSWL